MSRSLLVGVVTAGLFATAVTRAQEIELAEDYPLRDAPVGVTLSTAGGPAEGASLRVTYRPNSQTVFFDLLAADQDGHLSWTPRDAGIVLLELLPSGDDGAPPVATKRVAVRFGSAPSSGIAVMLVAGLLLFGGAGAALWLLLGGSRRPFPQEVEPPST